MNVSVTYLPNTSSHAWLMQLERSNQQSIGPLVYPLPQAKKAFAVRIEQFVGFAFEPRARFEHTGASPPLLTWNDIGVFAPLGPLPLHTTEDMLSASRTQVLASFVSAITQRLFHIYYQSWVSLRPEHERAMPFDRFQQLLQVMSGSHSIAQASHLAAHKPTLTQLPLLVARHMRLKIEVRRKPWIRISNDQACRLGRSKIGSSILGTHVCVAGNGDVHVAAYPRSAKDFLELRSRTSARRKELDRILNLCIGDGTPISIEIYTPAENWQGKLGKARLGETKLQAKKK